MVNARDKSKVLLSRIYLSKYLVPSTHTLSWNRNGSFLTLTSRLGSLFHSPDLDDSIDERSWWFYWWSLLWSISIATTDASSLVDNKLRLLLRCWHLSFKSPHCLLVCLLNGIAEYRYISSTLIRFCIQILYRGVSSVNEALFCYLILYM